MTKQKIICVDFDNTIHDMNHPLPNKRMGPPLENAQKAMMFFRDKGYRIVILTTKGGDEGRKSVEDWMDFYHIQYDEVTNIKPNAEAYIDDKAITFVNWNDILHKFVNNL